MPSTAPPPPSLYELPPDEDELAAIVSYDVPPGLSSYDPCHDLPPGPSTGQLYDVPPDLEENTAHYNKLAEELLSTEERYLGDLLLAKKLFHDNLIKLPYASEVETIFRHWDRLINVSRKIYLGLKSCISPGQVFISEIDSLSVFVAFCSHQHMALEALNRLLAHADAQKLYNKCTSSVEARGMTLSTFLLLPLGRITRYPLLIEKILRESNPKGALHQDLDTALQLLRALVSEVNRAVTEEENVYLLRWAQSHIKCPPSLRLDFTSDTRFLGLRSFLHSGVLYKLRSGRLLVGILFNDFLLLTTPDEHLSKPISFKISKTTDINLTLYKQPMLLANLKVLPPNDETTLNIKHGTDTISFKCVSSNARRLWTSQLEQAIDLYAINASEQEQARKPSLQSKTIGRLLVEVLNISNFSPRIVESPPHILRLSVGRVSEVFEVDLSKSSDLHLTTQFPLETTTATFSLTILQKNLYRPDTLLLDETTVTLNELLRESAMHRGPIIKAMHLRKDIRDRTRPVETVAVKFVAQLFDANM